MEFNNDNSVPIFIQVASKIEDAIFTGAFKEDSQVPSTTEISMAYKINPATVLKGMNLLVDENLIYKKRGLGLFVSLGARERIRQMRLEEFSKKFMKPMLEEAKKLELNQEQLLEIITKELKSNEARN